MQTAMARRSQCVTSRRLCRRPNRIGSHPVTIIHSHRICQGISSPTHDQFAAVLLGLWYAVAVAFAASVIRNAAGTGTLFAFPGSIIGAFLAGYIFQGTCNVYLSALGEIIGTGILGALISTLIIAPVLMGRVMETTALIVPFLTSSLAGSIIGLIALTFLQRASIIKQMPLE